MEKTKEADEEAMEIKFPAFFEGLRAENQLPESVVIGENEQAEVEAWVWENVFKKESVGEPGAWLYDHMERTSSVLEHLGINTHDFEHVRTVMVNACSIFLVSQGTYLRDKFDLETESGREQLFEKLAVTAIAALFHDIGYLECIDDETNFTKSDLDNHPLVGGSAIFDFGHNRIGRGLKRGEKEAKTRLLVEKLIDSLFQPPVAQRIKTMGKYKFYKNLRKVRAGISSHDSPDNQDGTDEAAKLDNVGGEAIAVYMADKTHIGQRMYDGINPESKDTINSDDITVVHDRLTYLIKREGFEIEYDPQELKFKLKLEIEIPATYADAGYNLESFINDFNRGFGKRYQHAQKVFRRLMHREHLNNAHARIQIEAVMNGHSHLIMELPKSSADAKGRSLKNQMKAP